MFRKVLICGLPGSGKTFLAKEVSRRLKIPLLNADEIRKEYADWDFSNEGRMRQANRMKMLANYEVKYNHVVCDFVCPTEQTRLHFAPNITVWMNTIEKGRFEDTNKIFEKPTKYDLMVPEKNADYWAGKVIELIEKK